MPKDAIPGVNVGNSKDGSFRVTSGEILPNLEKTKLMGKGALSGSPMQIGTQVAALIEPLASVDDISTVNTRWENCIFAGVRAKSGELYIMREERTIKVRSLQGRPEEERWNQAVFTYACGTHWEPTPGANGAELKSDCNLRGEEEDIMQMPSSRQSILREIAQVKET